MDMTKQAQAHPVGDYQEIPINIIITDGQSVREAQDDDHVVELAMSISKHGLMHPILVRAIDDGRYQLMGGFHRLAATSRLQHTSIMAHIMPQIGAPIKAVALIENIVRKEMSLKEQVEAVAYLSADEKLSTSSICDLLGKSRDWVDKRLMIPSLYQDIQDELMDGRISVKQAEALGRIDDAATRRSITIATIQQKLNARDTEELAKMYLGPYNVEGAVKEGLETIAQQQEAPPPTRQCAACGKHQTLFNITWISVCLDGCTKSPDIVA